MKKTLFKIVALCSTFALAGCDFLNFLTPDSDSTTDSDTPKATVISATVEVNKTYRIGDKYSTQDVIVTALYSDNTTKEVPTSKASVVSIKNPQNQTIDKTAKFDLAGTYTVNYRVVVDGEVLFPEDVTFDVATGFATSGFVLQSVEYASTLTFSQGEVVRNKLSNITLLIHWNNGDERYNYNINTDTSGITFKVRKQGDTSTEYINTELEQGASYNLILSYQSYVFLLLLLSIYLRLNHLRDTKYYFQ